MVASLVTPQCIPMHLSDTWVVAVPVHTHSYVEWHKVLLYTCMLNVHCVRVWYEQTCVYV